MRGAEEVRQEEDARALWQATFKDAQWALGGRASGLHPTAMPSMARLGEVMRCARERVCEEQEACVQRRQQQWKEHLCTLQGDTVGELHNLLKDNRQQSVTMLLRADGTLTASLDEVDQLLRKEWLPIFKNIAQPLPLPSLRGRSSRPGLGNTCHHTVAARLRPSQLQPSGKRSGE